MAKLEICERCGQTGTGKRVAPGSFAVEVVLWLLFCAPGLVYTTWRIFSARRLCGACAGELVPLESPRGQMLAQQYRNLPR
jgi:hypothetical protein